MTKTPDIAGTAALAICESLLRALNDRHLLPQGEIVGLLTDAAAAHENAPPDDDLTDLHHSVSTLIHQIINGGNSASR